MQVFLYFTVFLWYNNIIKIGEKVGLFMKTLEQLQEEILALKAQLDENKIQIEKLTLLNKWYEEQLKLSRQKRFGASSEKNKHEMPEQLNLFNEAEAEKAAAPFIAEPNLEEVIRKPKKKSKRGEFTKELPVEIIEYKLPETEQSCPNCHDKLHVMKQEIRKELKIIPVQVMVVEHVTNIYACRSCDKNAIETPIVKAPAPSALIAKSLVSPSVLAYIMNQKFTNAMPLNRQEQDFKRFGVNITRQNLSN
jgi:transposase